jgi:hypothetical protein
MSVTLARVSGRHFDHADKRDLGEQLIAEAVLVPEELSERFGERAPRRIQRAEVANDIAAMRQRERKEPLPPRAARCARQPHSVRAYERACSSGANLCSVLLRPPAPTRNAEPRLSAAGFEPMHLVATITAADDDLALAAAINAFEPLDLTFRTCEVPVSALVIAL